MEALPTSIPESLVLDVSSLEINDNLTLEDLVAPEGVELVADDPAEITMVTLSPPRVEEEPEADVEEEPGVVGEEAEAEGEAPTEDGGGEESSDEG